MDFTLYDLQRAREIALQYGNKVIERMSINLHHENLVDRGNLLRSLKVASKTTLGELTSIEFRYEFYGAIWERGASNVFGKGITLHPRKWRDEAIEAFRPELELEFGEVYAKLIIQELFGNPDQIQL